MLTLLPMAVGCYTVATVFSLTAPQFVTYYVTNIGWVSGALGLGASGFHLGRPLRAWRIFLGWRRSWLSREAMVFGPWFALATAALALPRLVPAVSLVGLLGLVCSVMIYADTRREFWRVASTAPRFFGSAAVLGLAVAFALSPSIAAVSALGLATLLKLAVEIRALRPLDRYDDDEPAPTSALKTARLLTGPLGLVFRIRILLGLAGGVLLPPAFATPGTSPAAAWLALALVFSGELAERYLFFRAVDAPKMPGLPAATHVRLGSEIIARPALPGISRT